MRTLRYMMLLVLGVAFHSIAVADMRWPSSDVALPTITAPSDTTRYGEDDIDDLEGTPTLEKRQPVNYDKDGYDATQDIMEDRYVPLGETFSRKKWLRNVFLQGGVGIEKMRDPVPGFHVSPLMHGQFGIGKEFSRLHAVRLMLHGDFGFRGNALFAKAGARLDHVFDVTSYLLGYNPTRLMSVSSIIGVGGQYSRGGGKATSIEGHLGAQLRFYTGPKTYVTVEPYVGIGDDKMDNSGRSNWRKYDLFYGVNLNLVYYLGNNLSPESRMRLIEGRHYRNTLSNDSLLAAWQQPWFVMFSNGISQMNSPNMNMSETTGSEMTMTLGKWLSPVIGLRGSIYSRTNIWLQTTSTVSDASYHPEYTVDHYNFTVGARLDAMFNPLGFLRSFHWDTDFGFYLVAGAEAGWIRKSQSRTITCHTLGWGGGINVWYQLAPGLKAFVEPRVMFNVYRTSANGSHAVRRYFDRYQTLNIGLAMELRDQQRFYTHSFEDEYVNDPLRHIRVGLAGGTHFLQLQSDYSSGNKLGWNGLLFGEYHFNRLLSVRLGAEIVHFTRQNLTSFTDYNTALPEANEAPVRRLGLWDNRYTMLFVTPGAQIDLTYLSLGYQKQRFRAYAFAGPAIYWVLKYDHELANNERLKAGHRAEPVGSESLGVTYGVHLGIKLQYAVSRRVAITLVPTAFMMGGTHLPGIQFTKLKLMETINLGAQYSF